MEEEMRISTRGRVRMVEASKKACRLMFTDAAKSMESRVSFDLFVAWDLLAGVEHVCFFAFIIPCIVLSQYHARECT